MKDNQEPNVTSQKIASVSEDATPVRKRMSIIALFFMFYVGVTQQKQILGSTHSLDLHRVQVFLSAGLQRSEKFEMTLLSPTP